jgi:methyl-accepting chemotaxis protein
MENFSFKIKTRGKLIIGFAVIVLSTIAIITLTYNNIERVERVCRSIQEMDSIANQVSNLRADFNRNRALSLELLMVKDEAGINSVINSINKEEVSMAIRCEGIDSMLYHETAIRALFRNMKKDISVYTKNRDNFFSLIANGKREEAYNYFNETQTPYYNSIREQSIEIESKLMDLRKEHILSNERLERSISAQAILFGAFLLLINMSIAIFILRMLRKITSEIRSGIEILAGSSANILTTFTDMSTGASETAAAVSETTATIEEVRQTATLSNQKAKSLIESSQKVSNSAEKGKNSLSEVMNGMELIDVHMKKISETVIKLSEQNRRIGEITSSVSDIADQSNLLAVNAAIEAAKAGEHGRGFTVVAQEIRNLADQSKRATIQVKEILNEVNKSVNKAVEATDDATKTVETGKELVTQSGEVIEILSENIEEAGEVSLQISSSNHQQMAGMDQIVPAMENIKKASEQNVAGMQKAQKATHEIHNLGQSLKRILIKYNL